MYSNMNITLLFRAQFWLWFSLEELIYLLAFQNSMLMSLDIMLNIWKWNIDFHHNLQSHYHSLLWLETSNLHSWTLRLKPQVMSHTWMAVFHKFLWNPGLSFWPLTFSLPLCVPLKTHNIFHFKQCYTVYASCPFYFLVCEFPKELCASYSLYHH